MFDKLIQITQSIVSTGGPFGVFAAAILEEVIFFIPSPLVPMAAGFFLLPQTSAFGEVIIPAVFRIGVPVGLGLTIGSLLPYYFCYFGGRSAVEKWGRFIGLSWKTIEETEKGFIRGHRDEAILFTARVLPIMPSVVISGFCGFVRYPVSHFIAVTAAGAAIRGFFLGIFGWYAGAAYLKYAEKISEMEKYLFVPAVLAVALIIYKFTRKQNEKK
ncbi:MAG: VTT domain-containing protein [Parcubacteria group bacterium]|nr:VTT domain-containing protein [Parcubacteria group bacterium]